MKEKIEFKEFLEIESKLEIKVGKVIKTESVEKSNKLLKLEVDFGNDDVRVVVTNIKNMINIDDMLDNNFCFVTNLVPTKIMGIESFAMILPGEIINNSLAKIISNPGNKIL